MSSNHSPRAHGKSVLKGSCITARIYFSVEHIIEIFTSGIRLFCSAPEVVPEQDKSEWIPREWLDIQSVCNSSLILV